MLVYKAHGHYSYLRIINHSEIGVICANLAIVWGPHIVIEISWDSNGMLFF